MHRIELNDDELLLAMEALAKAAARLECEANYVKCGHRHDERAAGMRQLRVRLMKARASREAAHA